MMKQYRTEFHYTSRQSHHSLVCLILLSLLLTLSGCTFQLGGGDKTAPPEPPITTTNGATPAITPIPTPAPVDNLAALPPRQRLAAQIDAIFNDPRFSNAFWGVVVQTEDGRDILYSRLPGKSFMPASNMKLLTTAAGLYYLGEDFRWQTQILWVGDLDRATGTLNGDLIIAGAGDPAISGRYREDGTTTTMILDEWAAAIARYGIRRVNGRVIGDGSFFTGEVFESTWELEDFPYWYATNVTALAINDNCFDLTVESGPAVGDPARVSAGPALDYVTIINDVKTIEPGARARIDWQRWPDSNTVRVTGTIGAGAAPYRHFASLYDGNRHAAQLVKERLIARGIPVSGEAAGWGAADRAVQPADPPRQLIYTHLSPPLRDIVAMINKPSQNFYADMLLRTLGRQLKGEGSFVKGAEAVRDFMAIAGAPDLERVNLQDGSGLSRRDLIQPRQIAAVLTFAARQPWFPAFHKSLPVAGRDGTLSQRMRGTPAEGIVSAKTGTVAHVRGLSGYLPTADGHRLVFVTLGNHYTVSPGEAGALQDALCELLVGVNYAELKE